MMMFLRLQLARAYPRWWNERVRRELPKIYSRELVEVIFVRPYCRIGDLVSAGIGKRRAASVYLKTLVAYGVLQEMKVGRENLYIKPGAVGSSQR
jgi:hypothetical protein